MVTRITHAVLLLSFLVTCAVGDEAVEDVASSSAVVKLVAEDFTSPPPPPHVDYARVAQDAVALEEQAQNADVPAESAAAVVKLIPVSFPSPPPPPEVDHALVAMEAIAHENDASHGSISLFTRGFATASVCSVLALLLLGFRCWRQRRLAAFLNQLPDASPDQKWIVVAYEWDNNPLQSGTLPLTEAIVRQTATNPHDSTHSPLAASSRLEVCCNCSRRSPCPTSSQLRSNMAQSM
jgi:hypothetical protein